MQVENIGLAATAMELTSVVVAEINSERAWQLLGLGEALTATVSAGYADY